MANRCCWAAGCSRCFHPPGAIRSTDGVISGLAYRTVAAATSQQRQDDIERLHAADDHWHHRALHRGSVMDYTWPQVAEIRAFRTKARDHQQIAMDIIKLVQSEAMGDRLRAYYLARACR